MDKKELGAWGEAQAAEHLKRQGYKIEELNFNCRFGEVDIILSDAEFIVFAEVKLRKNERFATAREFVTAAKQERVRTSASLWLSQNETEKQPRFDVVEIYAPDGVHSEKIVINHIENAF